MARQLQAHQLDDRKAVAGLPGRNRRVEQEHLGRATSQRHFVDFRQPGIYPCGIGPQGGLGIIVLYLYRPVGKPIEVQPAQELVDGNGARAKNLRQPPLDGPAQDGHLPQPILGMGIAQSEKDIRVGLPQDMRDIGGIPDDFDRRIQPVYRQGLVIVGQGLAGQKIDQPDGAERQQDKP